MPRIKIEWSEVCHYESEVDIPDELVSADGYNPNDPESVNDWLSDAGHEAWITRVEDVNGDLEYSDDLDWELKEVNGAELPILQGREAWDQAYS